MTVAELITWLQTQPATALVYLHDPDTGWFMPLKGGLSPDHHIDERDSEDYTPPVDAVIVHARYGEANLESR